MHNGYGCRLAYFDKFPKPDIEAELSCANVPLETILTSSDVVITCVNLTAETRYMINRDAIAKMKGGTILLNLARSEIVDTEAVLDALESGRLAKYITDVFHIDPVSAELAAKWKGKYPGDDKLIVTPHTCFASPNTMRELRRIAIDTIQKLVLGEETPNRVKL
jgi:D-lactate dehydrogenase